jgi:hypothetical protein
MCILRVQPQVSMDSQIPTIDKMENRLMDKKIELKIDKNDDSITLQDVVNKIQELQEKNPDLDVFFDGDEFAVCSRPKNRGK